MKFSEKVRALRMAAMVMRRQLLPECDGAACDLDRLSDVGEADGWHAIRSQPLCDLYFPERCSRLPGPRDASDNAMLGQSPYLVLR